MKQQFGLTRESPKRDKKNHCHCPCCGRIVKFSESTDDKKMKWHYWECPYCGAYDEHGHNWNGFEWSYMGYKSTSEICYCGERLT